MSMALSRFEQARRALESARAIQNRRRPGHTPPDARAGGRAAHADETLALRRGRAFTLDTAGKVARYCGELAEAEGLLHAALELWRDCADEAGAAASLHELGVVHLRRADWPAATTLLRQSLAMKRKQHRLVLSHSAAAAEAAGGDGANDAAATSRFRDEAATLHQLAVAAMSSKPAQLAARSNPYRGPIAPRPPRRPPSRADPSQRAAPATPATPATAAPSDAPHPSQARLDEAKSLLHEALALEADGPFALGGRAATLQQLARVAERCGDRQGALTHLQAVLDLHRQAYGQGVPHVNKVSARHGSPPPSRCLPHTARAHARAIMSVPFDL